MKVRFETLLIRLNRLVCTSEDRLVLIVYAPVKLPDDAGKARVRLSVILPPSVTSSNVLLARMIEDASFPPRVQLLGPVQLAELEMAMSTVWLRM